MTLSRKDISEGLAAELDNFEALLRTVNEDELDKPSRCEG